MGIMNLTSKWWLGALVIFLVAQFLCSTANGVLISSSTTQELNSVSNVTPQISSTPIKIWNFVYGSVTWNRYKVLNDGTVFMSLIKIVLVVIGLTVIIPIAFVVMNFLRSLIPFLG